MNKFLRKNNSVPNRFAVALLMFFVAANFFSGFFVAQTFLSILLFVVAAISLVAAVALAFVLEKRRKIN